MQDHDLEFPKIIEFAYYSIYNLFCKYVKGRAIDDWIIVNQAISSEGDQAKWAIMLSETLKKGIEPGAPPNDGRMERSDSSRASGGSPSAS